MASDDNLVPFLEELDRITSLFTSLGFSKSDPSLTKHDLLVLGLLEQQKECPMSLLSKELAVSMSTMTGIVDKLFKKELVIRERNQNDRRVVRVKLTTRGKDITSSHIKQKMEMVKQLTHLLTREEFENLLTILKKISERINGDVSK